VAEYTGLREFLELLEREGDLARVGVPVALDQELGAVCVHSLRNGGPALLFQRPGGQDTRDQQPQTIPTARFAADEHTGHADW